MALSLSGNGLITGFDPTASGFGKVLQVVRATDTTDRSTTSTSFVDVTGMSVTITPQKSTSSIIVMATFYGVFSANTTASRSALFQLTDSSNVALSGAQNVDFALVGTGASVSLYSPLVLVGYVSPATLSAVTYKMRFKVNATPTSAVVTNSQQTGQLYAIEVSA